MGDEINKFFKVWLTVFVSLVYCYETGKKIPEGKTRFLFLLPIVCLFFYLPLHLSTVFLGGITAFFIAWLANFKILLFAFGKGPLSSNSSISLPVFLAISCFPITVQENPYPKSQNNQNPSPEISKPVKKSISHLNCATKIALLTILAYLHTYKEYIHPKLILCIYCLVIYFALEIILAMVASLVRTILRMELEPPFNEPYLSTSLQDFWGRRWNLIISSILRSSVHDPTLKISTRMIGRNCARVLAILATFFVSAIMHELIFFYLGRARPTWQVTWFFILHGFCLVVEVLFKRVVIKDKWRLPRMISCILTIGFVMVTGFWLFFPQLINQCRMDVRAVEEYEALGTFVNNLSPALSTHLLSSL
ncbi:acyl-CoA--sterol O-acyltransferase 1-like [Jatropha curcas]|uniref:acyl-CoA--sterol O-acyltransferase 1-like n=1 Tax=Jatropha curcas TaxID=180498 RepID=UPI0005FAC8CE|nr:acyl-CoA--sterol O-acyltransferase 1-like [Jatropha curcas]